MRSAPPARSSFGVFNGEGQNLTTNADSGLLWIGRATVRPIAYFTVGVNVARKGGTAPVTALTRSLEYLGAALKGEYVGQYRDGSRTGRQGLVWPSELPGGALGPARA